MSLFYILPIGGASYTLFKYCIVQFGGWRNSSNKIEVIRSARIKIIISFIAGLTSAILGLLWLCMIWIPSIKFPPVVYIFFLILMIPFMVFLAALGGLGKAVGAGAGSATEVLNDLNDMVSEEPNDNKR